MNMISVFQMFIPTILLFQLKHLGNFCKIFKIRGSQGGPAAPQESHGAFTAMAREESSFGNLICFGDKIDKIRNGFKAMTFFLVFI